MKRYWKFLLILFLVLVSTTSCSTEQRTLYRMNRLTTQIEKHGGNYSLEDWKEAQETYKSIAADAKQCEFTPEQREKMGEMEGRCLAGFAKWAGGKVTGIFSQGKGLLEGILNGLDFSEDE